MCFIAKRPSITQTRLENRKAWTRRFHNGHHKLALTRTIARNRLPLLPVFIHRFFLSLRIYVFHILRVNRSSRYYQYYPLVVCLYEIAIAEKVPGYPTWVHIYRLLETFVVLKFEVNITWTESKSTWIINAYGNNVEPSYSYKSESILPRNSGDYLFSVRLLIIGK